MQDKVGARTMVEERRSRVAVVLIGVSGSGKSTVGRSLAPALGATFLEGDAYHGSANIAKMRAGVALRDADRWPWLDKIGHAIRAHVRSGRPVVVACSALTYRYRLALIKAARVPLIFVHLALDPVAIEARLQTRRRHFMPASLLDSQLNMLEALRADENGTTIVTAGSARQTRSTILRWLRRSRHEKGRPSRPLRLS